MSFPFRYRKLAYVALNVTDLTRSLDFYTRLLGLQVSEKTDEVVFLRCGRDHHNIILHAAPEKGVKRVGFELESDSDVETAFTYFDELGYTPYWLSKDEAAQLKQGRSFRLRERHSQLQLEMFSKSTQMAKPFEPTVAQIARLGHVVIGTVEFEKACEAFTRDFNFKVSDLIEDRISFMRCHPNPLHHTFAVGPAKENQLHHVNFMVTDIDDIGRALYRMKNNNVPIVYGPGRHPPSNSVFLYFQDPDGMTLEYSFGMEEFPEEGAREPRMLEAVPESLDTWGAVPHPEFGKSGPIEVES